MIRKEIGIMKQELKKALEEFNAEGNYTKEEYEELSIWVDELVE